MTFNPLNILRRRARAKGFGVHSPFAYRFITEVLSEHLRYYDYDKLESKIDRTLYRISVFFYPTGVYASDPGLTRIVSMACHKAKCVDAHDCDLAVFSTPDEMEVMIKAIECQSKIVLIGKARKALGRIKMHMDALQCGMLFDNTINMCVIVPSHKLPRQDFELTF